MNVLQVVVVILLAPLLQGAMRALRARLSGRPGPSIWQPYRDLWKLCGKHIVVTEHTGYLVLVAPGVSIGVALTFVAILPSVFGNPNIQLPYDAVALALLLALGRFVLVLAALDTRSGFEGMAVGREIAFASLTEAPLILALLGGALSGTESLDSIQGHGVLAGVLAAAALLLVMLSETARVPVDNQETHYELTMIHEGLLLEYSGWQLALLQSTAYLRQIAFFVLAAVLLPGSGFVTIAWMIALGILTSVVEATYGKLRMFEVPQLFSSALVLAIASLGVGVLGVMR
jgi:formate hydrogenlyase subunit 4